MIEIGKMIEIYAVDYALGVTDPNPTKFTGILKVSSSLRMIFVSVVYKKDQEKLGMHLASSRCCVANPEGKLVSIFKEQQFYFNGLPLPSKRKHQ